MVELTCSFLDLRNHVPWDLLAASMGAAAILLLVLRFLLAAENKKREREQHDDTYDHVHVTVVEDGKEVRKKVDKVCAYVTHYYEPLLISLHYCTGVLGSHGSPE
jgi:hypothetical protein